MIDHAFLLLEDHLPKVKSLGVIINSQYMHNAQLGQLIEVGHQGGVALRRQGVAQGDERAVVALLELPGGLLGSKPCRHHPRLDLDRRRQPRQPLAHDHRLTPSKRRGISPGGGGA